MERTAGERIDGEDGGGIAMALGTLGRGGAEIRVFEGVNDREPRPTLDVRPALGVLKGELVERVGEGR